MREVFITNPLDLNFSMCLSHAIIKKGKGTIPFSTTQETTTAVSYSLHSE
jgi:hypothetical protein